MTTSTKATVTKMKKRNKLSALQIDKNEYRYKHQVETNKKHTFCNKRLAKNNYTP